MLTLIRQVRERYEPSLSYQRRQETIRKNREQAERRLPPTWDRAGDHLRGQAYASTIIKTAHAVATTINFSPRLLERAGKAPGGVFQFLRRRVTLALKTALGHVPAHTLALDEAGGRFHLHGFIAWPSGNLHALRDVLEPAAGEWAHKRGQEHQIHLRSDQSELKGEFFSDDPKPLTAGFSSYSVKIAKRLRKETNQSVLYASPELKRDSELQYSASRALETQQRIDKISQL